MADLKKRLIIKILGTYINGISLFSPKKAAQKAYKIFCTPRAGKLREKDITFLKTATRWIDLEHNGDKIQCYEWAGSGEKVLLAHGWESNSARWHNLIKSLQKADFQVIAIDAPAHGGSGSSTFQALRYAQFMDKAVEYFQPENIVAHSVGGFAALFFLTHNKHTVKKAVVLGAPSDLSIIMKNYQQMMGYSERVMRAIDGLFIDNFGHEVAHFKTYNFVKQLKINGLIIHGKDDLVCPFSGSELVHKNWENSKFIETEGLGHGYQGKSVYSAVREWLKTAS
jgi:pimeloyl-ACP methyl ester carboxylesterase